MLVWSDELTFVVDQHSKVLAVADRLTLDRHDDIWGYQSSKYFDFKLLRKEFPYICVLLQCTTFFWTRSASISTTAEAKLGLTITMDSPYVHPSSVAGSEKDNFAEVPSNLVRLPEHGSQERLLAERKLVRILDTRLLPTLFVIYIMNYIDVCPLWH
jgi:hypothetical protein